MSFDPETAYRDDWQYLDRVKEVDWERSDGTPYTGLRGRWGGINTPDISSVAASLGLTSDAAAIVVWQPKPSDEDADSWEPFFRPRQGDVLRRVDTGEGWIVKDATELHTKAKWLVVADREVTNA